MKTYFKKIILIKICLCVIHFFIPLSYSQDIPTLLMYFRNQSIPVEDIKMEDNSVILRLHYETGTQFNFERLESDILTISKKIATEFPDSQTVRVEYFEGEEKTSEIAISTKDILDWINGDKDEVDILADMDVNVFSGFKELLSSEPPPGLKVNDNMIKSEPIVEPNYYPPPEETPPGEIQDKGKSPPPLPEQDKKEMQPPKERKFVARHPKEKVTPSTKGKNTFEGEISYLGVQFTMYEKEGIKVIGVIEDSPAEHAGLQKDDLILEIEENSFREKGYDPNKFAEAISKMPVDRPLRFHIERKSKRFDVWIKLRQIEREELQDLQDDYEKGRQLMMQKDYSSAIEYFNKSIKSQPKESNLAIGICYLQQGVHEEALEYIVKAYKIDKKSPRSTFYLAACCDRMGNTRDAVYYYKKYLKFKHDNPEMNAFARKRLKELKNKSSLTKETLMKVIDAIIKEIK